MSYDVAALFTSIPVKPAIEVIKKKLEQDTELHHRISMSIKNILDLLEFCLCNTYFLFQGQYYVQTQGAAMGSSVSPVLANLYMEFFEDRAHTNSSEPPQWWKRFVDDTFVILKQDKKEEIPAAHKLCGPSHMIYHKGTEIRWFHALLGHFGHPSGRWNTNNKSIQEDHPYRSIFTMG